MGRRQLLRHGGLLPGRLTETKSTKCVPHQLRLCTVHVIARCPMHAV